MMFRVLSVVLGMLLLTAPARGSPYWIAYEGNDFPENEGWTRYSSDPPAERWLEGGSLFIDTRADWHIIESYAMDRDGALDPQPAETFVMRWGLKVHEAAPWEDPGVAITSDDQYAVTFVFAEGYVTSTYEGQSADFAPGVFHDFEMRSTDMRSYELYIDGELGMAGAFHESLFPPGAGFGDLTSGVSLAQWDYFRFGVVPEPSGWLLGLVAMWCTRRRKISLGRF